MKVVADQPVEMIAKVKPAPPLKVQTGGFNRRKGGS
jgi:hypothetical protein